MSTKCSGGKSDGRGSGGVSARGKLNPQFRRAVQVPVVRKEVAGDLEKEDGHLDDLEEGEEEEDTEEDFESRYGPVVSVYNLAHLSHKDTGLCDISVCEEIAIGMETIGKF